MLFAAIPGVELIVLDTGTTDDPTLDDAEIEDA